MTAKGKLIRNIVIEAVILSVLAVSYVLVTQWEPDNNNGNNTGGSVGAGIVYVTDEVAKDVESVNIKKRGF